MTNISRKHLIIITVVVMLVVVIAISTPTIVKQFGFSGEDALVAKARVSREIAYAGENISFSSSGSTGDINNYTWKFGDGNSSSEPRPLHVFELPGWYNVTLTVADKGGKTDSCQLVIGIQHPNNTDEGQGDRVVNVKPRGAPFFYWSLVIGPNIHNPTVDVDFNIQNGIGKFWIDIYTQIHFPVFGQPCEARRIEGPAVRRS